MLNKVGFIGLGQMGKWMALNLLGQGFELTVFDTDDRVLRYLSERGASHAVSPEDVARRGKVTFLCLPDVDVVHQVVNGREGVAAGAKDGHIIVDCGTSDFRGTTDLAKSLAERGIRFVDAPVTGMQQRAREATLSQKAVRAVVSTRGVTTALVGMRRESYVDDILKELGRHIPRRDRRAAWRKLQRALKG